MRKIYEIDVRLQVAVENDCPMRASDKVVKHLHKGPYKVLDWGFTRSIYPQLRKEEGVQLQELKDNIIRYLNDYDVIDFAEKHNIKLDAWLKAQLFDMIGEIRTEIIMEISRSSL